MLDMARPKNKKEFHMSWNAWEEMLQESPTLRVNILQELTTRFLRDPVYRESQLAVRKDRTKSAKEMDELAQEDFSSKLTPEEKKRYHGQWYLTLNKSGKYGACEISI